MIFLLIAASIMQGPTQRGERSSSTLRADHGEQFSLDSELFDGSDWEGILGQSLALTVTRNASLMAPLDLSWRGARTQQVQWSIDGLPLGGVLGGSAGVRSIDPHLLGGLTAFSSSGASLDAPIAGEMALRTAQKGHRLALKWDQFNQRSAHLSSRYGGRSLSLAIHQTPGIFRYLDPRGTTRDASDDQWVKRSNNDARRAGVLWRESFGKGFVARFLITSLAGGVPGTGSRALRRVREEERLQLAHVSWQAPRGAYRVDLSALQRAQKLDDPTGEFSGLLGLQPRSVGQRVYLSARQKKRGGTIAYEWTGRGFIDRLNRRPGPTLDPASGYRIQGQAGATIQLWLHPKWRVDSWVMLGQSHESSQDLIDQLPESLQNQTVSPSMSIWSPGLSLDYRQRMRLRLIAGRRAPTLLERIGQHGGLRGNPELKAERSWTLDFKLKNETKNWRFVADSYVRQSTDLIDWTSTSFGRAMPINRARVQIAGLHLKNQLMLKQLLVSAAYRWQGEWAQDSDLDTQYKRLSGSPEHRLRVITQWQTKPWKAGLNLEFKSARFLDAANLRRIESSPEVNVLIERRWAQGWSIKTQLFNVTNIEQSRLAMLPGNMVVDVPRQDRWGHPLPGRRLQFGISYQERP